MLIFLDTEFTDLLDPVLISLGMVAEDGQELYLEVPFPVEKCTAFVREAVLPHLGGEPNTSCTVFEVRCHVLTWIETIRQAQEEVLVCVDNQIDIDLLYNALEYRVPGWMACCLIGHDVDQSLINRFFAESGLPRHHALHDARANRYAYRPRATSPITLERRDERAMEE